MYALSLDEKQRLDSFLNGIDHLPSVPVNMIQLIKLFQEPEREVDDVIRLLSRDPSLVIEVLRRCNNSFFGNEQPVTDVNEALFRLGFYEVYRLTVSLFGRKAITTTKAGTDVEIESIWRHSTITAVAGGAIARELAEAEGIVFTAGLLHDIGKIVLALAAGNKYAALMREHGLFGSAFKKAETAEFGFSHAEVGAWLLARWDVPELIAEPIFQHHRTDWDGPFGRPAAIVNLADIMAHAIDDPTSIREFESPDGIPSMNLLGLKREDLPRLELSARADLRAFSKIL